MKQLLSLLIFSVLLNSSVLNKDKNIDIELVSFGLYKKIKIIDIRKVDTNEKIIENQLTKVEVKHLKTVDLIKPEIGTNFGLEFKLLGTNNGDKVNLTVVHNHPEMTLDSGKKVSVQYYNTKKSFNDIHHCNMLFENDYELISGIWNIQIFNNDIKILEKSFTLK
ncbi:MAG: DUF3859 domain-containing protein [Campylobacterota bacterium]|nr:DUF3859 domain-containing protein [Campylobacterota bacterium]